MSVITLSVADFAKLVQGNHVKMLPVAVAGFVYAVIEASTDSNIYRVAVA